MNRIVKIVLAVLGVLSAILWYQLPSKDVPVGEAVQSGAMNFMFIITYLLLGIAVVVSLLFTLKNLFSNPKSLKKTLFIIVGFLLVVAIAYVLSDGADGTVEAMASRGVATTESTVKKIGMGLNVFFILTVVAVGSMIWGGIKKMSSK
ncbi:hypothetical protein [Poritiphilus flavus]|uniref:Uncharacterized protein n=1 Tax=Poritiphilus flavus TaxID=2697053 RepID=A0A6L9E750_9FLAO|nr:hypothetical protein [Poritiphilus flavus]NAS10403.1 hypothetical protein [Poritiphilus flavus]